jgi:hypothetical protein
MTSINRRMVNRMFHIWEVPFRIPTRNWPSRLTFVMNRLISFRWMLCGLGRFHTYSSCFSVRGATQVSIYQRKQHRHTEECSNSKGLWRGCVIKLACWIFANKTMENIQKCKNVSVLNQCIHYDFTENQLDSSSYDCNWAVANKLISHTCWARSTN